LKVCAAGKGFYGLIEPYTKSNLINACIFGDTALTIMANKTIPSIPTLVDEPSYTINKLLCLIEKNIKAPEADIKTEKERLDIKALELDTIEKQLNSTKEQLCVKEVWLDVRQT
jgi:hypothetical protein